MSKPVVYIWPPADETAIALGQDVLAEDDFLINGAFSNIGSGVSSPVASFDGISRTVSITSILGNDYSGVSFIVSGTLNSSPVFEELGGPEADSTVETEQIFDTVTSITADQDVADVSIGSGSTGRTRWYNADYNKSVNSITAQVAVVGEENEITYSFLVTLDDVQINEDPTTFGIINNLIGANDDQIGTTGIYPINYCCFEISNSSGGGGLTATIIEGGTV